MKELKSVSETGLLATFMSKGGTKITSMVYDASCKGLVELREKEVACGYVCSNF